MVIEDAAPSSEAGNVVITNTSQPGGSPKREYVFLV